MKPLQAVAMGLLVITLQARYGGYDVYPDPLGWVLVLLGVRGLPTDLRHRGALTYLGVVALLVSVPLWLPVPYERLGDADPALAWAANLPSLAFFALLAGALAASAAGHHPPDDRAAATWRGALVAFVAIAALPVLVFGAGVEALGPVAAGAAVVVPVLVVAVLFTHGGRAWALRPSAA